MRKNLCFTLIIALTTGYSLADSFENFFNRMESDWQNMVLEELPLIKGTYDPDNEQKCLERLAKSKVEARILLHKTVDLRENLIEIRNSSEEASFALLINQYHERSTLITNKARDGTITFLFTVSVSGVNNKLFCFAEKGQ